MPEPRLHLDADASLRALHQALLDSGHDVTRTPTDWAPHNATDETQLLEATARGRVIFSFNVRDFLLLAERYPRHGGIVLAVQRDWAVSGLIASLDHLLSTTSGQDWPGRVRWLSRRET